jgi:hypothetical protein
MKHWTKKLLASFRTTEIVTLETRKKTTLKHLLWGAVVLMLIVAGFRSAAWLREPTSMNSFYLANSLFGILVLVLSVHLNNAGKSKTASTFFLIIAFYLCLTAYPIRNPEQVLLYYALPSAAASFITRPRNSIWYAFLCAAGFTLVYFLNFQNSAYPFFSLFCLFLIAFITWQASAILEKTAEELATAYDTTIEGWSQALEMRNQETEGHSHRVADLTMRLVKQLRINESRCEHIRRGVLLHDIGKMGVPDTILCKPGPLTPEETAIMHNHPQYAFTLLEKIPYLRPALEIPFCHHEKWDGTGYPRGIKGEEIPLAARIFSVVDVWDAMRSKRSYRAEIPEAQVIDYLRAESGRSFDPRVVEAFFEMMGFPIYTEKYSQFLNYSTRPKKSEI